MEDRACRARVSGAQWRRVEPPARHRFGPRGRSLVRLEDPIEPNAIATALAKVALDKKAGDVAILDMQELVDYTDVFVLCTGRNRRHVAALAEEIRTVAKRELGLPCLGIEGLPSARWVLVDFGSVVVHLFDEPLRPFYNLDGLWSDAPRLPVPDLVEGEEEPQEPTTEVEPHP